MIDMNDLEDQPLGYLLSRVANALRAEVTATVLDPMGLAFGQYICLRILAKYPGRSNAELARDTNVTPQAMNMVLKALQERGLVTRPATVASGRSLPAELTRRGTEVLTDLVTRVQAAEDRVLGELTDNQKHQLRHLLSQVTSDPTSPK